MLKSFNFKAQVHLLNCTENNTIISVYTRIFICLMLPKIDFIDKLFINNELQALIIHWSLG